MLKVIEAVPLPQVKTARVGQVIDTSGAGSRTGFGISTGDGVLGVLQVQLEGKRSMSAAEFLRGQRQLIRTVLPSLG
jgi:methionyl-tRNA formyltransferase